MQAAACYIRGVTEHSSSSYQQGSFKAKNTERLN